MTKGAKPRSKPIKVWAVKHFNFEGQFARYVLYDTRKEGAELKCSNCRVVEVEIRERSQKRRGK